MNLYRGQGVEERIGFWWSDHLPDAEAHARVTRSNLVLRVEVGEAFAAAYLQFDADGTHGRFYKIPHEALVTQAHAVEIIGGRIGFPHFLLTPRTQQVT